MDRWGMGLDPPVPTTAGPYAALIKKLCASGRTTDARRILGRCEPDVMAYNAMVVGYGSTGQLDTVRKFMWTMPMESDVRAQASSRPTLFCGALLGLVTTQLVPPLLHALLRRVCSPSSWVKESWRPGTARRGRAWR
jgi:hypothetical protein